MFSGLSGFRTTTSTLHCLTASINRQMLRCFKTGEVPLKTGAQQHHTILMNQVIPGCVAVARATTRSGRDADFRCAGCDVLRSARVETASTSPNNCVPRTVTQTSNSEQFIQLDRLQRHTVTNYGYYHNIVP